MIHLDNLMDLIVLASCAVLATFPESKVLRLIGLINLGVYASHLGPVLG